MARHHFKSTDRESGHAIVYCLKNFSLHFQALFIILSWKDMACPSKLFLFSCWIYIVPTAPTSILSLLFSDSEPVDCWSVDTVLMSSCSSRSIWLSLTGTVLFEFSGWLNKVFIPVRIMNIAGTVGDVIVYLKRTGSHWSKSVTAGSHSFRPSSGFTGVFLASWNYCGVGMRQRTHLGSDSWLE